RLGESADVPLIESMTVRLLAGQNAMGGWDYYCPALGDAEVQRLKALLKQRNELVAGTDLPKPKGRREFKDLPREIQAQLEVIRRQENGPQVAPGGVGDNSNTQFV